MRTGSIWRVGQPDLAELCGELLGHQRLVVASNRGPVEYVRDQSGQLQAQRGRGGLVSALSGIAEYTPLLWVACVMSEGDRAAALASKCHRVAVPDMGKDLVVRFAVPSPAAYHGYYNLISNPLLWFAQHYLWGLADAPSLDGSFYRAWEQGYVPVNRLLAQAIVDEAQNSDCAPFVMIHDYQLYLVARLVRRHLPHVILQHFVHIPWPAADYWQFVPRRIRTTICSSLCANDIVGFQTARYMENFLHTCERVLPAAQVDYATHTVRVGNHVTRGRVYPISVDVGQLRRTMESASVRRYQEVLRPLCNEHTIVRVDRTDPSKNIVRGFQAFDLMLTQHPELRGRVSFLAFLVPSRTSIPEYQRYKANIDRQVAEINSLHGTDRWTPIRVFYESNYPQALAAMSLYDVLLVNPLIDGMNLVAKEGPVVNTRNGVLVLSEMAGAYEQLRRGVVSVSPTDVMGTSEGLYRALTMPARERHRRAAILRRIVEEENLTVWLFNQLEDMRALAPKGSKPATPAVAPPPQPQVA